MTTHSYNTHVIRISGGALWVIACGMLIVAKAEQLFKRLSATIVHCSCTMFVPRLYTATGGYV